MAVYRRITIVKEKISFYQIITTWNSKKSISQPKKMYGKLSPYLVFPSFVSNRMITLLTIQKCTVQFSFISNLKTQHFHQKLSLVFSVTEFEFCTRHLDSPKCFLCCIMLKATTTQCHCTQSTSPTWAMSLASRRTINTAI